MVGVVPAAPPAGGAAAARRSGGGRPAVAGTTHQRLTTTAATTTRQAYELGSLQLPADQLSGPLPLLVLAADRPLPNEPKAPAALLVSGCGPGGGSGSSSGSSSSSSNSGGSGWSGSTGRSSGASPAVTASSGAADNATLPVQGSGSAAAGGASSGPSWGCCLGPGCGRAPQYAGPAAAELRGRSSQAADKKSYALELRGPDGKAQEVSLLGLPAASDWVLASLALDRSLIRDALAFSLARAQGRWAPRSVFVELYVVADGSQRLEPDKHYRGVYALTEPVDHGSGRLGLKSMPSSAEADPSSGGIILELSNAAATQAERAPSSLWGYASSQLAALASAATATAAGGSGIGSSSSSSGAGPARQRVAAAADVGSLVDFLLHTELACDYDGYVSSVFLHKDAGKQLVAGPVWDKNLAFGNEVEVSSPTSGCGWRYAAAAVQNSGVVAQWYGSLARAAWWRAEVAERWRQLRSPQGGAWSDSALVAAVDGLKQQLLQAGSSGSGGGGGGADEGPAVGRNTRRWPPQSVRSGQRFVTLPPARGSWQDEVAAVRSWLLARAAWMDGMLLPGGRGGGGGGGEGGGGGDGVQLWVPAQPNIVSGVVGAVMAGRPVTRAFREGLGL
ncbi:hypothetical protein HYH02_008947 [Chlamydomonas schloesseri]|uniref:Uncharacterized protein n=1 Tax=Chlamydomonas schloesseri TaxID=2026947 RepID=A0A835WD94_9CHLO|nr:hypothetical protein HYH02_008947 [Chlamydomonas schloesseri]|eukprot:KAG2445080.1 hypothetical protein HYH02_008947 [Chlamydomonas schloesseri]